MALIDIKVRTAKPTVKQYKLTDGNGIHLLVHPNGSRYWRLQYRFGGKQKILALGIYQDISFGECLRSVIAHTGCLCITMEKWKGISRQRRGAYVGFS